MRESIRRAPICTVLGKNWTFRQLAPYLNRARNGADCGETSPSEAARSVRRGPPSRAARALEKDCNLAVIRVADRDDRRFFTVRSLAEKLEVSERTVRNWMKSGELASYRLGDARRIDPADVDSFLAARRETRRAA